jgi:hypothetical protein
VQSGTRWRRRSRSVLKFVPCSFSLSHYSFISLFLLSFSSHHHKQKLHDDKSNGKRSLELSNAAIAENARLREQGVGIDPDLTPGGVYDVAKRVADQLVADLPDGHRLYVLSSYSGARIKIEAWASTTNRGGRGARLVTLPNREPITGIPLQNEFGWVCEPSVYETNNQENMNRVEKTVHWILFHDPRSMWLECGMGGVHQKVGELRYFSLS